MADEVELPKSLQRVPTGVAGLDEVLQGGFFRSGIYMIMGRPGTGKTTLGSQIAFNHVARGGRAICLTLLTDSHDRMLAGLQSMSFYDSKALFTKLSYLSAYQVLEAEKLPGLLKLLRNSIREYAATLLVIDGVVTAEAVAPTELDLKKFLHELQVLVELFGCTALLLTGSRTDADSHYAERTMVDGLMQLSLQPHGAAAIRQIEVLKHRASDGLLGQHVFTIGNDGVTVYPRIEAHLGRTASPQRAARWSSTGSAGIDQILGGGLAAGSVAAVVGAPGTGKSSLGLQFLAAGAAQGERGHLLTFHAPAPSALEGPVGKLIASGKIGVTWQPDVEPVPDIVMARLFDTVRANKVQRLVIDGVDALAAALAPFERTRWFFAALCNELRSLGVTTLLCSATSDLMGILPDEPADGYWGSVDSVLLLRYVERDGDLARTLIVSKHRTGQQSTVVHAYSVTETGIEVPSARALPGRRDRQRVKKRKPPAKALGRRVRR
jgi:circadian clock protein KaiC